MLTEQLQKGHKNSLMYGLAQSCPKYRHLIDQTKKRYSITEDNKFLRVNNVKAFTQSINFRY